MLLIIFPLFKIYHIWITNGMDIRNFFTYSTKLNIYIRNSVSLLKEPLWKYIAFLEFFFFLKSKIYECFFHVNESYDLNGRCNRDWKSEVTQSLNNFILLRYQISFLWTWYFWMINYFFNWFKAKSSSVSQKYNFSMISRNYVGEFLFFRWNS